MPAALLVLKYRFGGGKEKTYTFAAKQLRGSTSAQPIDNAFHDAVYGPRMIVGDFTSTLPGPFIPGLSLAETVIRFIRGLAAPGVTITRINISDGKTPGPLTGPFSAIPLNLPGTWFYNEGGAPADNDVAPGPNTILLGKQPAVWGEDIGHTWLRFSAKDSWFRPGGDDEITWNDDGAAGLFATKLASAITNSGLAGYLAGTSSPSGIVYFGQAHFWSKAEYEVPGMELYKGVLKYVTAVRSISVVDAANRQTKKGRKRPITEAQAAAVLARAGIEYDADALAARLAARAAPAGPPPSVVAAAPDDAMLAEEFGARPPEE